MKYSNNPFNIRYYKKTHWLGQIEPKNGFCQFEKLEYGVRAWMYLMCVSYLRRDIDMTLRRMLYLYAPPSDGNDHENYVRIVTKSLGCSDDMPLRLLVTNDTTLIFLGNIMAKVETGSCVISCLAYCVKYYKPKFPKV